MQVDEQYRGLGVKALGNGRVGGYLVIFSTAKDPDLAGEFFTKSTDFDLDRSDEISVYYDHGKDPLLKARKLGEGKAVPDDIGVWFEAQLDMRDKYEQMIYTLAEKGKLGWSSGTAAHLVERESKGKSTWIKKWPLGLDASLTPTPCEPRTLAEPLKSMPITPSETPFASLKAGMMHHDKFKTLATACKEKMRHGYLDDHDEDKCYWGQYDDMKDDYTHHAIPYTMKGETVKLGDPMPVKKKTVYEPDELYQAKSVPLGEDLNRALAAVEGVVNRLEEVKTLRAADGRNIGAEALQKATDLKDRLTSVVSAKASVSHAGLVAKLRLLTLQD